MHLTKEEERIYDGELGWAYQTAMKILVKLGDLFGAARLIPIESAHLSGVSYKTIGEAPIEFLEAIVRDGAKFRVSTTVNPSGFDYSHLSEMFVPLGLDKKQLQIIDLYEKIRAKPVLTCTPYYLRKPKKAAHLAWAESSAVVYANSILGSWTNREGGPSALAAALIGKTPDYGMHRRENRQPNVIVKVETELENEAEFGALGTFLGGILKDKVPIFGGLSKFEEEDLKQMGAAMASTGMTSIFYPCGSYPSKSEKLETLNVERKDLEKSFESLSTTDEEPDMVFMGCPHCSFRELKRIAEQVQGRKVKKDVRFWVCTSRHMREKAGKYVNIIEEAGGKVISDTCAVVTWLRELGVDTLMTNSAKTAYYAPTLGRVEVRFTPPTQCINIACC